ncbi:YraN family protein [Paenibacillus sanguinis]|uniref:YraN family protein n=1 Tax=Paenibacillus sanguinis TaxID=225906 RepID=UPI00037910AD|nr:YraN family protein [Paenibacillus sanguinis]
MGDERKERGRRAELAAAEHLLSLGYAIMERNWRCRSGEIDLIARQGDWIVIVEVRSRSGRAAGFGTAAEAVTPRKIAQVRSTAAVYLHQNKQWAANVRFDVIAVTFDRTETIELEHIEGAF